MSKRSRPQQKLQVSEQQLEQKVKQQVHAVLFKGPLPSPDMIERYETLYPGAADFFFSALQKQSEHRMELEKRVTSSNIANERRGQWFAFIICLLAIGSGVYLILKDKDIAGLATLLTSLGGILGVFFIRKQRTRKELQQKSGE